MKFNKAADLPFLAFGLVYVVAMLIDVTNPILNTNDKTMGTALLVIFLVYSLLKRNGMIKVDPDYGNPNQELLEQLKDTEVQQAIVNIVKEREK